MSLLLVCALLVLGMAGPKEPPTLQVWQAYDGTAHPRAEVARLGLEGGVKVHTLDGRRPGGGEYSDLAFELLPGTHTIEVSYSAGVGRPGWHALWGKPPEDYLLIIPEHWEHLGHSSSIIPLRWEAVAGGSYRLITQLSKDSWDPRIVEWPEEASMKQIRIDPCWLVSVTGTVESVDKWKHVMSLKLSDASATREFKEVIYMKIKQDDHMVGFKALKVGKSATVTTTACKPEIAVEVDVPK